MMLFVTSKCDWIVMLDAWAWHHHLKWCYDLTRLWHDTWMPIFMVVMAY